MMMPPRGSWWLSEQAATRDEVDTVVRWGDARCYADHHWCLCSAGKRKVLLDPLEFQSW